MAAIILRDFQPDPALRAIAEKRSQDVEKRTPSNLKLYALAWSICSQRVRLAIEEKQLPYDEHTVDFSKAENLEPWYLEMNPRGVVPTISENDQSLFDSYTIMLYVNNQYKGPELTPDDNATYDLMLASMKQADLFPIRDFAYRKVLNSAPNDHWRIMMHDNVIRQREKYPELKHIYDKKLADYASLEETSKSEDAMAKVEADCEAIMDKLDAALGNHKWIVADTFCLADIAWLPIFLRLEMIGVTIHSDGRRPNISRFIDQWKQRPVFKTAIEDHYEDMAPQMAKLKK